VLGAFNPTAVRLPNKKILLYLRISEGFDMKADVLKFPKIISDKYDIEIEKIPRKQLERERKSYAHLDHHARLEHISHFNKVILDETGFNVEEIDEKPIFTGTDKDGNYGVEDPRIVKIGKNYYMTYVSISYTEDICTSLAASSNLKDWKRKGIIFRKQNKDVVLFPEKIKGKYVALHRPQGDFEFNGPSIWISHSKDILYWGDEKMIMEVRDNAFDSERIGAGPPPIKTEKGWLLIYHGTKVFREKLIYSVGAALLDLKDPSKIIARSSPNKPLLFPEKKHEKRGYISNVIFPTAAIWDLNKKDLLIYSGAGDKVTTVKKIPIDYIFKNMVPVK
jgi:predicted GH43/DUF377 family glycosyl hydrolase